MKLLWCFLYSVTLVSLCSDALGNTSPSESTTNDHLEPPDERFEPMYRKLLSRRLFMTPANYVRVVDLPSPASVGESTVAVYSRPDKPDEVGITYTKAARNLYYAAFSDNPNLPKDPQMKIARCDAMFPKPVANAIGEGIGRVLAETRPRRKGGAIILHGTEIEFSIEDSRRGTVRGLLTPYAQGKNGAALRRLTQLLKEYCDTKPLNRAELAQRIEAEASAAEAVGMAMMVTGTGTGNVGGTLSRFGKSYESATRLAKKSEEAEKAIGIHGVSASEGLLKGEASTASKAAVQQHFPVHKTGREPHRTIELPNLSLKKSPLCLISSLDGRKNRMNVEDGTPLEAVFGRVICLVYYDGPVSGLAETNRRREVYRFDKVAWDDLQDLRIFVFATVPLATFDTVTKRFSQVESPQWPMWVPHLDADLVAEASSAIPAGETKIVIASDDALATIKLAKRVLTARDTKRVNGLVDANASVADWIHYMTAE